MLLACLPAALAGLGCGDDDDASSSAAPTPTPAATQPATPEPAAAPATDDAAAPAKDATKPSAEQLSALGAANNAIALEDDSAEFDRTGPIYAANYRKLSDPLADGPCKTALEAAAANWIEIGKLYAAGKREEQLKKGEQSLDLSIAATDACG